MRGGDRQAVCVACPDRVLTPDWPVHMQSMVKQYIDGVSLNDSVLAQPGNPLFVVNGRVNLNRPLPVRLDREALTVVDANHMIATNRVNTRAPL